MESRFATDLRSLVFSGGFGVACFVLSFTIGQVMLMATGIPATGGLVAIIPVAFIATVGTRLVNRIGFLTIMWIIATGIAIPTMTYGPPGIYKLIMGIGTGVIWEFFILLFRRNRLGFIIGSGLGMSAAAVILFFCMLALGLPAADKLQQIVLPVTIAYFLLGASGGFLGILFFNKKLAHLAVVRTIQEVPENESSTSED